MSASGVTLGAAIAAASTSSSSAMDVLALPSTSPSGTAIAGPSDPSRKRARIDESSLLTSVNGSHRQGRSQNQRQRYEQTISAEVQRFEKDLDALEKLGAEFYSQSDGALSQQADSRAVMASLDDLISHVSTLCATTSRSPLGSLLLDPTTAASSSSSTTSIAEITALVKQQDDQAYTRRRRIQDGAGIASHVLSTVIRPSGGGIKTSSSAGPNVGQTTAQ